MRESRLTEVEQALQAFKWHRGLDTDAVGLVDALKGLREASLEVVRAVVVSQLRQGRASRISGGELEAFGSAIGTSQCLRLLLAEKDLLKPF